MKQILIMIIFLGMAYLGVAQPLCFSYDAAGNRTSRIICVAEIKNPTGEDGGLAEQVVTSVADDVGGSPSDLRNQLLSNDISAFVIYPNPSSGIFQIDAALGKEATINIYDGSGKSVWKRDHIPDHIDLMHLNNGSYYMVIYEASGVRSALIIISK